MVISGDLGSGCFSDTTRSVYGVYDTVWVPLGNSSVPQPCVYDDVSTGNEVVFTCVEKNNKMTLEPDYGCIATNKTDDIANIADVSPTSLLFTVTMRLTQTRDQLI